jgi:predicted HTH domain antitoxin
VDREDGARLKDMGGVTVEFPEDVLLATGQTREEFVLEATVRLFERGRLSSGKAAELCGLGRREFFRAAAQMGVPAVDLDREELSREFADG